MFSTKLFTTFASLSLFGLVACGGEMNGAEETSDAVMVSCSTPQQFIQDALTYLQQGTPATAWVVDANFTSSNGLDHGQASFRTDPFNSECDANTLSGGRCVGTQSFMRTTNSYFSFDWVGAYSMPVTISKGDKFSAPSIQVGNQALRLSNLFCSKGNLWGYDANGTSWKVTFDKYAAIW